MAVISLKNVEDAHDYARKVVAGEIIAGRWARLACERHLKDLERSTAGWRCVFDAELAQRACNFIQMLPHVKGKWARRREKIKLTPWMSFVVCSIFGWVDRVTRLRRFTNVYIEVGRKNAKSTLLAACLLYLHSCDAEVGAEVYSAAGSKDQAKVVFNIARQMAQQTPQLEQMRGVYVQRNAIRVAGTEDIFEPLASQTRTLDGLNPSAACLDELHAHKSREVYDVLQSGMGARDQPLLLSITTAGYNVAGICYEVHSDLKKVLQGIVAEKEGDDFFGIIFAADDGDEPGDPATWAKANPNLGISVNEDFLSQEWTKAKRTPAKMGEFLRKYLCIWTSVGAAAFDLDGWSDKRHAGARAGLSLRDFSELDSAVIGLDGSKSDDFTSAVLIGFKGDHLLIWDEHWATEHVIEAPGNEHLNGWLRNDWLYQCEGALIDYADVEARVFEIWDLVGADSVSYDPQYLGQMAQNLNQRGVEVVEMRQNTLTLDPPFRWLQGLMINRQVIHRDNPVMTWMVSNTVAQVSRSGDLIHPAKMSPQEKIDGVQAVLTGLALMEAPEDLSNQPIYVGADFRVV